MFSKIIRNINNLFASVETFNKHINQYKIISKEKDIALLGLGTFFELAKNVKELLEEKGITRYRLAKLADTRFEVVEKWCSGSVERIDSDVLARFCYILDCEIADIIKYNV